MYQSLTGREPAIGFDAISCPVQVAELKDLCRQEHMKGYSKLKKDELISKLQQQLQDEQQAA